MSELRESLAAADTTFNRRQYADATEQFRAVAARAEQAGDVATRVEALSMTARGYLIRHLNDEGRPRIEQAGELAAPDEPAGWSRYLGVRGRFEWQDDRNDLAAATFRQMYDYCREHELPGRAVDAAHMVAIVAGPDEQVEWARKGIDAAEAGDPGGWLGPLWNNLGGTYWDLADQAEGEAALELHRQATDCYLKAREYHWKHGGELNKLIADWAVGSAYRRLGEFDTAEAWLRPVLAWAERLYALEPGPGNGEWVGWAKFDLGVIALERGELERARELLTVARERIAETGLEKAHPEMWQPVVEAYGRAMAGE